MFLKKIFFRARDLRNAWANWREILAWWSVLGPIL